MIPEPTEKSYRPAIGLGFLALCAGVRGVGFQMNSHDILMEKLQACDALCQEASRSSAIRGERWLIAAAVLLLCALAEAYLVSRDDPNEPDAG